MPSLRRFINERIVGSSPSSTGGINDVRRALVARRAERAIQGVRSKLPLIGSVNPHSIQALESSNVPQPRHQLPSGLFPAALKAKRLVEEGVILPTALRTTEVNDWQYRMSLLIMKPDHLLGTEDYIEFSLQDGRNFKGVVAQYEPVSKIYKVWKEGGGLMEEFKVSEIVDYQILGEKQALAF